MTFASIEFGVFMLVVYGLYGVLRWRAQNLMLLVASYVFYGWWDWRFLSLIVFSTFADYYVAIRIEDTGDEKKRKQWLFVSLISNLGLLGVFKYYNFFAGSLQDALAPFGVEVGWTTTYLVLPVGISFYTFQTLSYTIDVYRRQLEATRRFSDFALFVAFFPQLVAGPIERASSLLPEIARPRTIHYDDVMRGLFLILLGLFKKVAIADGVAGSVNAIYNSPGDPSGQDVLLATYLFAIQVFCDFSGYSDVARGLAKTLGFNLMNNFDQPYAATGPQEFWRRWHISLSTWLRDYLYVSLGGNRGGPSRVYRNLGLTMLLGGLWHGAAWNFVLWGVYHGSLLSLERWFRSRFTFNWNLTALQARLWWLVRVCLFFQLTCYGWLLFRADSMHRVLSFSSALLHGWQSGATTIPRPPLSALLGLAVLSLMAVSAYIGGPRFYRKWPEPARAALVALMFIAMLMGLSSDPVQFIYFQF